MHSPEQRLVAICVGALVFGACFAGSFIAAFHTPKPHDVRVGLVAPASVAQQVEANLEQRMPGAFEFERLSSPAAARRAVDERDVSGALVAGPSGADVLIAEGGGKATADAVTQAFSAVAEGIGQKPRVSDLAPLPEHDSQGLAGFFLATSILLPSLLLGAMSSLVSRGLRAPVQAAALVAFAIVLAAVNVGLADWVIGALSGSYLALTGIATLFSLAVSAPTAALARMAPPGAALAVLTFVIIGFPASGGPGGLTHFVPAAYRWIEPGLPLSAAVQSLRSTLYFDANAVAGELAVLGAWALGGLLVMLGAHGAQTLLRRLDLWPTRAETGGAPAGAR